MMRSGLAITGLVLGLFASFSASANYQLNSYGLGPAGTNSASSTTYSLRGALGEQANGTTNSTTYQSNNGSINASQLNTPPAPSLSNGNNSFYNKLLLIINSSQDPSNSTYSVEVSTNNFTTYSYLQADGSLSTTPVYQSYSAWGGSSGIDIVGLANSTTYEARVDAQAGKFSDTNFSVAATASTVAPSISFGVNPNTIAMGSLLPGSVVTSPSLSFGLSTNANSGGAIYIYGQYGGLYSAFANHTIAAVSGNLSSLSEGFGVQASNPTETSGGPFEINSIYAGTSSIVGGESTIPTQFISSAYPITNGSATAVTKAITSSATPPASDYSETLTFLGAANF
jgi:hypothetical protein